MARRFGQDFSHVRVHTGAAASNAADTVNARAFAVGNHVVFRGGAFAPGTHAGDRLLAHELVHVMQQSARSSVAPPSASSLRMTSRDHPLEREAGQLSPRTQAASGLAVSRVAEDESPTPGAPCWDSTTPLTTDDVHDACRAVTEAGAGVCPGAQRLAVNRSGAAPDDPVSKAANAVVNAEVDSFGELWDDYPYSLIVVPGFTPTDSQKPVRMHETQRARLSLAVKDWTKGKAPFVFVSGGAVYPTGTPCFEGVEMKHELATMGGPLNRIIVDAAAQHSPSNIRNAGRYMLAHKIPGKALVTTTGAWQAFFFAHPTISSFHKREIDELGFRVGKLGFAPGRKHVSYRPSETATMPGKDPWDL